MTTPQTHTPAALAPFAVPAPQAGAGEAPSAPEWIEIVPAGAEMRGHDGRGPYRNTRPQDVVAEFERRRSVNRADLVIDYEHGTERAIYDGSAPAAGWIDRMEVRHGAVWGHVSRWTPRAAQQVAAGEYRYLSPVILHLADGTIVGVRSVALTADPNLGVAALNRAGAGAPSRPEPKTMDHPPVDTSPLAHALGLSPAASVSAMTAAIEKLKGDVTAAQQKAEKPDPEQFVSRADHKKVQDELAAAQKAMAERDEAVVEAEVQAAIQAGKIPPADKDYHVAACKAEGGLEKFRTMVAAQKASPLTQAATMPKRPAGGAAMTPQAAAQAAQKYRAECAQSGVTISTAEAVAHVMQGG